MTFFGGNPVLKAYSHELCLTFGTAADGCISTEIGNFLFSAPVKYSSCESAFSNDPLQHFVFGLTGLVDVLIPDVPPKLKLQGPILQN